MHQLFVFSLCRSIRVGIFFEEGDRSAMVPLTTSAPIFIARVLFPS